MSAMRLMDGHSERERRPDAHLTLDAETPAVRDALTVVGDRNLHYPVQEPTTDFNLSAARRELHGVRQEIQEHLHTTTVLRTRSRSSVELTARLTSPSAVSWSTERMTKITPTRSLSRTIGTASADRHPCSRPAARDRSDTSGSDWTST